MCSQCLFTQSWKNNPKYLFLGAQQSKIFLSKSIRFSFINFTKSTLEIHHQNLMGYLGLVFLVLFHWMFLLFNLCNSLPLNSPYGNYSLSANVSVPYANRDVLLSALSNTPSDVRFFSKLAGSNPNPAHLLFQCRGDVTDDFCKKCEESAIKHFQEDKTPNLILYVLHYNECWLYYSGYYEPPSSFLAFYAPVNIIDPKWPITRFAELMEGLVPTAISSPSLYANFVNVSGVYGFVQCTPNISRSDCTECLTETIAFLPTCCDTHTAATVLYPKCIIRYAREDFFEDGKSSYPPPLPLQHNPPPISGEQNSSSKDVVTSMLSFILGVILISMGTLWG